MPGSSKGKARASRDRSNCGLNASAVWERLIPEGCFCP
jgi:hypothetical protein